MSGRRCRAKAPNKACPSVKVDCSRTPGHKGPHQFKLHGVVLQSWKNTARPKATKRAICPACLGCYADGPCVCGPGCGRPHAPWPDNK